MTKFTEYTIETAPTSAKPLLEQARKAWGFVPTLHATLAESPVTLEAYLTLFGLVAKSTFSAVEQQVVYLTVTVFHECEYCTAGHTYLARSSGMAEDVLQALRGGAVIADPRLQALRAFTERVLHQRGSAGDEAVDTFLAAGFTKAQVFEVVTVIATKTISNYVNHLAHTPKESFMADPTLAWVAPRNR